MCPIALRFVSTTITAQLRMRAITLLLVLKLVAPHNMIVTKMVFLKANARMRGPNSYVEKMDQTTAGRKLTLNV
jgi:hypothetical protein